MIVSCPDCQTHYQIDGASLEPSGRRVRCQNCEVVWFQEPVAETPQKAPQNDPVAPAEDVAEPDNGDDEQRALDDKPPQVDIETEAARLMAISQKARQKQQDKKTRTKTALGGWMLLAACVSAFIASGVFWRKPIVKLFPAAAELYAAVWLPVNVRGIEFKNITLAKKFENGVPVLTIRGELANITDENIIVPRLRFGLRNRTNQELYHWTMKINLKTLPPAGRAKFVTRLASPPGEAQHVQVRFARTDG